ncbi:MAG: hypothetical protein H0X24_04265 [Ktedonobacterales bacterium]|nr:hypothetical protein [Ktedonobacterales bacterium]
MQSFTQSSDADVLDAANLWLALVDFLPVDDPRMQGTITAITEQLAGTNGLLYRYQPSETPTQDRQKAAHRQVTGTTDDGLPVSEGTFTACTFWLSSVFCLADKVDEAQARFEHLLRYASPLGLFAEEIDPETGRQRGNYPQAFTHLGLINAALHLAEAQRKGAATTTHHR